jgi:hypothetical protein
MKDMERPDEEAPFAREPWRRLLAAGEDGPPETTDARIRAAARRDLAPRGRRWWLPASLAASFVLAVVIAQSQFGTIRRAPMTESDRTGGTAMEARIIDRSDGPEAREEGRSPDVAAPRPKAAARQPAPAVDHGYPDEESGSDEAGAAPRVSGPEHEVRAASEPPAESSFAVPDAPAPAADAAAQAAPPTPEAWYAQILELRALGRTDEAERELERLRRAWPGWLEQRAENLKKEERR